MGKPGPVHRLYFCEERFQRFRQRGEQKLFPVVQIRQEKQRAAQQAIVQILLKFLYSHPGHCLGRYFFQLYDRFIDDQIPSKLLIHKAAVMRQRPLHRKI